MMIPVQAMLGNPGNVCLPLLLPQPAFICSPSKQLPMALAPFKCTACYTSSPFLQLFLQVAAKKLERRLAGLGGTALLPLGLGDDQHPSGYEAALDPWLLKAWAALRAAQPLPEGMPQVGREGTGRGRRAGSGFN